MTQDLKKCLAAPRRQHQAQQPCPRLCSTPYRSPPVSTTPLRRGTVVSERVDGAARQVGDDALGARGADEVAEVGGRLGTAKTEEVGSEAGNVGGSHGGAADNVLLLG